MKKMLAVILSVLMLCSFAAAEETAPINAMKLAEDVRVELDLDGDGAAETVSWNVVLVDEYSESAEVLVEYGSGLLTGWSADYLYGTEVYASDVDSDGKTELFISGDEMSDDYVTYCLRYENGALAQLEFPDVCRGENTGGYFDYGYGRIVSMKDNVIELSGSQDALGTYMMSRFVSLRGGRFEAVDDGCWTITNEISAEEWEYRALTAAKHIRAQLYRTDVAENGIISMGTKLCVTGTDKRSQVSFVTEDGTCGFFTVAPDVAAGWGFLINDTPESDLFLSLPYAD